MKKPRKLSIKQSQKDFGGINWLELSVFKEVDGNWYSDIEIIGTTGYPHNLTLTPAISKQLQAWLKEWDHWEAKQEKGGGR